MAREEDLPPIKLENFRFLRPVGQGGMGTVYLAEQLRPARRVAVKVVAPDPTLPPAFFDVMRQEGDTAARFDHEHLVHVYECGIVDGYYFLAMQLLPGGDLAERFAAGIEPAEGVRVVRAIAAGLQHIHAKGFVHRDVKPTNVLFTEQGKPVLVDFGVAKDAGSVGQLTEAGLATGTPAYMSPEQIRGQTVDARSDLYSLGVLLYEALAGAPPFAGPTGRDIQLAHLRDTPPRLPKAVDAYQGVIDRLLAKSPEDRFADAGALIDALDPGPPADEATAVAPAIAARQPDAPTRDNPAPKVRTASRMAMLVLAVCVLAVSLFALDRFLPEQTAEPDELSVAVLPFANLSGDESQEYFSDGMSDELIGLLGRLPELRVIGRTSSFQFKDERQDLRQIGRELGVTYVVDGSVRRSGETVRVTAELLSAEDGAQLWSRTFDRQLDDMLRVQNEIGRAVVATLRVQLLGDTLPTPATLPVADAYDSYLRGLRLRRLAGPSALEEAEALFEEAVALDPTLAAAWDGLAVTYINQITVGTRARDPGIALAEAAVERTLTLDPTLASARYAQAFLKMVFERDWSGAEESYRQCLEVEPNHPGAHSGLGLLHAALGRHVQAREFVERAAELDPLNLTSYHNLGFVAYLTGDFAGAEAAYRRGLSLVDGAYPRGNGRLSMALLAAGRAQEALAMAVQDPGELWRLAAESMALHVLGEGGDDQLQRLESEFPDRAAVSIARIHAVRGAHDEAMAWLDRADGNRDPELTWILADPLFESLRGDRRFQALLARLGLDA